MSRSSKCYALTREILLNVLPHPSTVQKLFAFFRISPGYIVQSFTYLLKKAQLDTWKFEDYLVSFCFDEFAISPKAMLDLTNERVIGPHKECFVIMACGLAGKWELPVYINFDVSAKTIPWIKSQLCKIYEQTIIEFEQICFKVLATVSDQGGKNRGLASFLEISPENYFIPNPYDPSRKVFFLYDFVHEYKLLRNHTLDDTFKLPSGKTYTKRFFTSLIDASKNHPELTNHKFALNDYILNVKASDRQDVGSAVKLLSRETAAMIRKVYPNDHHEIAEMLETMSDAFKLMTSKQADHTDQMKRGLGTWYEGQKKVLEKALYYISNMSFKAKDQVSFTVKPFQIGMQITINGTLALYETMKNDYGVEVLCTVKTNQCYTERKFGVYRELAGSCSHPPALTALRSAAQDLRSQLLAVFRKH